MRDDVDGGVGVSSDVLVIGAGMAGVVAGCFLAPLGRVRVLEMEPAPAYHSTGRSAAHFSEYFGNPAVRRMTAASWPFLRTPPPGFDGPLVAPRGVLALCPPGAEDVFDRAYEAGRRVRGGVERLDEGQVRELCPVVRPGRFVAALLRPSAMDLDVAALHAGMVRGIRAAGGEIRCGARVRALARRRGSWYADTDAGTFAAPIVVNAAGAWADELARLAGAAPQGLVSRRRTVAVTPAPDGYDVTRWPMVTDVTDTFYFKPESGRLLLSPADSTPVPAGDVRPDDLDVALAAHRFEEATTVRVRRITHRWAGLRTSTPDDIPVIGADPAAKGFHWLAGLGGYGIQLAPACGRLLAAAVTGTAPDGPLAGLAEVVAPRQPTAHRSPAHSP
ncbi:NAD(P)/FAD-dependent oxidoreductase [Plantactinospora siamensis]|uniref:NAD(P)/FAD-dependent oxidoreductase n=1 Tax=Plantactinospora siamensis TaxID=555372 RepID=A0ABV6NS20_9ACTN